mmetsp:Transcript_14651/g.14751  ORF Transcript_14651/g.14751 Transcript_14651/m.14751 type:complete len:94 (+) Transcript_14651:145-426(+)
MREKNKRWLEREKEKEIEPRLNKNIITPISDKIDNNIKDDVKEVERDDEHDFIGYGLYREYSLSCPQLNIQFEETFHPLFTDPTFPYSQSYNT